MEMKSIKNRRAQLLECKRTLADVYHTLVRLDKKWRSTPGLASMLDARLKILEIQKLLYVAMEEAEEEEQDAPEARL